MEVDLSQIGNIIGKRVEVSGYIGTIRYYGPLIHPSAKKDSGQKWLGIEWDDKERGKHNGTVEQTFYFDCIFHKPKGTDMKAGSLITQDKVNFGITLELALMMKYCSKNTDNDLFAAWQKELYVFTSNSHKKMIELIGMPKLLEAFSHTNMLEEIALQSMNISEIDGSLNELMAKVRNLYLDHNLLYDWSQYFTIINSLPQLNSLSLRDNKFKKPDLSLFENKTEEKLINKNLKILALIGMELNWKDIEVLSPAFKCIEELWICRNNCSLITSEYDPLKMNLHNFDSLKVFNVEENGIYKWTELAILSSLPNLEKIIASLNFIENIPYIEGFPKLQSIFINGNKIENLKAINSLNKYPNFVQLRINDNPYEQVVLHNTRFYIIGKIGKLNWLNGSSIKPKDRRDSDLAYSTKCFEDFLEEEKKNPQINLEKFMEENHPRWHELIAKYGYPLNYTKKQEAKLPSQSSDSNWININLVPCSKFCEYKQTVNKRISLSYLVKNLKGMCAKIFLIDILKLKLVYLEDEKSPPIHLSEDLRQLSFYNIKHNSMIRIENL